MCAVSLHQHLHQSTASGMQLALWLTLSCRIRMHLDSLLCTRPRRTALGACTAQQHRAACELVSSSPR